MQLRNNIMSRPKGMWTKDAFELSQTLSRTHFPRPIIS